MNLKLPGSVAPTPTDSLLQAHRDLLPTTPFVVVHKPGAGARGFPRIGNCGERWGAKKIRHFSQRSAPARDAPTDDCPSEQRHERFSAKHLQDLAVGVLHCGGVWRKFGSSERCFRDDWDTVKFIIIWNVCLNKWIKKINTQINENELKITNNI